MNTAESVKFLSTKDKHKGQNVISTDREGKHQHFNLYPNTYLSVCSIYKMLLICRLANSRYKIHSAPAELSEAQYSLCYPWTATNAGASVWSTNIMAPTHQEHNICLLVKCSCHTDTLALPSRQINTLETSRRKTSRQLQTHQLNIHVVTD